MNKSESIINLIKATTVVMQSIRNIDKRATVGTGSSSYKGVSDKDVKLIINEEMAKNGLAIYPIAIEPKTRVDRWETSYNGQTSQKQQVFVEVLTTYLLCHESGEYIQLQGYGHGVDTQDKAAGKATTYALKYTLLYTFLVATGNIDDTDTIHSNQIETPPTKKPKPELVVDSDSYQKVVAAIASGGYTVASVESKYTLSPEIKQTLLNLSK